MKRGGGELCRECPEKIYSPNCDPGIPCPYQDGEDGDMQWLEKEEEDAKP